MKIAHIHDSSYVYLYILDLLYTFKDVSIKAISYHFDYDISTIYKILKKIEYNLLTINPYIQLIKIKPGIFRFVKVEEFY